MTSNTAASAKRGHGRLVLAIAATLSLAIPIAGCGSSSSGGTTSSESTSTPESTTSASTTTATTGSSSTAATGGALSLAANPEGQLKYDKTSLSASAGKVSIDFTNTSPIGHNLTIENSAGETLGATPTFQGGSKTLTLDLKPGTYKFFCSVPGHRMAGMEGTLVVK